MSLSSTFSICSLFYNILLIIVFFSKEKMKTIENKIYGYLIVSNFIGVVLAISSFYCILNLEETNIYNIIVTKGLLIYYAVWQILFGIYVFSISCDSKMSIEKKKKYLNKVVTFYIPLLIAAVIAVIYLPLHNHTEGEVYYTYGMAANVLYLLTPIVITSFGIRMLFNYRNLKSKKYLPVFLFVLIGAVVTIIQRINPGMLLMTAMETFITVLMYFTIENPDVKVINELNRNKDILEKNNEDRSNFLFRMTQEVRKPISNIDNLTNMIDTDKYVKLEDIVSAIKSNTRQISYIVNDVLDVSSADVRKIKIENNKYDAKRLFEEINLFIKDKVSENVKYSSSISSELPEYLNGDNIKIKQAIMSILLNSVENTKKGFIELNVSVIVKYDMCRLIITVEDSGVGMNISKVNDILTLDKPLDEKDEDKLANMDVDLNITKKIINIIGGSIMIKSEVDKGTEFIVVIDQKIETGKKSNIKTNYNESKKRVLIVDDDLDKLNIEKELFIKHDIDAVGTMYGLDVINKISTGEKFDYIILDDDTVKGSAKSTLDELKEIPKFDTPVIVMLEENKKMIKEHYKEIGFSDYILKDDIESSINEFIKKMK